MKEWTGNNQKPAFCVSVAGPLFLFPVQPTGGGEENAAVADYDRGRADLLHLGR